MKTVSCREIKNLELLFNYLKLENILEIVRCESSQNIVYKINNKYIVKKFSHDAIGNRKDLNKRKLQIEVSEILRENNIKTITPLKFKNKYFIYFKGDYYLIYNYFNYQTLDRKDINDKKIVVMGSTMANIHNLNIVNNLPCSYSKIDINLDNYLNKVKKYDIDQYNLVLKNKLKLMKLINEVNDSLRKIKKNKLCISHNDYKYLNMLWNKNDLYLLDFDACGMSLPNVALVEAAYALSLNHNQLDLRHYKLFLKSYLSIRNINEEEYDLGIKMAMNCKLQWLNYMISKTLKRRDSDMDEGIRYMINELVTFQNNKLKMMNAYLSRK